MAFHCTWFSNWNWNCKENFRVFLKNSIVKRLENIGWGQQARGKPRQRLLDSAKNEYCMKKDFKWLPKDWTWRKKKKKKSENSNKRFHLLKFWSEEQGNRKWYTNTSWLRLVCMSTESCLKSNKYSLVHFEINLKTKLAGTS